MSNLTWQIRPKVITGEIKGVPGLTIAFIQVTARGTGRLTSAFLPDEIERQMKAAAPLPINELKGIAEHAYLKFKQHLATLPDATPAEN